MNTPHPMKGLHAALAAADSTAQLEPGRVYDRVELSASERKLWEERAAEAKLRMAAYIEAALASMDQPSFDASAHCDVRVLTLANEEK
jgi:hypothetical protein